MKLIKLLLVCSLLAATGLSAQEAAKDTGAATAIPELGLGHSLQEVELLVVPLTLEQLQAEADKWQNHVGGAMTEIAQLKVEALNAEGGRLDAIHDRINNLTDDRALMIGAVMPGCRAVQATASVAGLVPTSCAMAESSAAASCIQRGLYRLLYMASVDNRPDAPAAYLPVNSPPPRGEYDATAIPSASAIGRISTSACRFTRLYIGCRIAMVRPKDFATASAFMTCQAA